MSENQNFRENDYENEFAYSETEPVSDEVFDDYTAVIRHKTSFYKRKFRKMNMSGDVITWNGAAFLVPACWALYRKMYGIGAAFLIIHLASLAPSIAPFLTHTSEDFRVSFTIFSLPMNIIFGILANYLYKMRIEKLIHNAHNMPEYERSQFFRKYGGVNLAAGLLPVIAFILSALIIFAIIIFLA